MPDEAAVACFVNTAKTDEKCTTPSGITKSTGQKMDDEILENVAAQRVHIGTIVSVDSRLNVGVSEQL